MNRNQYFSKTQFGDIIIILVVIIKFGNGDVFMKKFLSSVLVVALSLSVVGSAYASEGKQEKSEATPLVTTVNLLTDNDAPLGTLTTSTSYHREKKKDRVVVTITTSKDYELNSSFVNDSRYTDAFKDSSNTITIEVTNDKKYFVDGKQLSESILNQTVDPASQSVNITASDTGGVPELGHYYSDSAMVNYYFATYSGMTMGGSADGSHVAKNTTRYNSYFNEAANTLDILYGDHQSYLWAKATLSGLIVAFPFTVASIVGAIADGGSAGVAAATVYSYYRDCNNDLSKAYNLVSQM